jgi:ribonucleoside-diphosphate reductase beta chain
MAGVEVIHNNAYQRLLEVLGMEDIFEENLKLDVVAGRVNYLRKYNHKFYKDSRKQYVYALILFTLFIENVSLFSQFYIILWFGRFRNVLKDTTQQVTYTKNEELIHAKVGMKLVNTIRKEHPELFDEELEGRILNEAGEAFKAESKIIDWIIGGWKDKRISAEVLKEYIKSRINDSLKEIGFRQLFSIDESLARDFEWMDEEVLANNAVDFFYQRPVDYAKANKTFELEDLV